MKGFIWKVGLISSKKGVFIRGHELIQLYQHLDNNIIVALFKVIILLLLELY